MVADVKDATKTHPAVLDAYERGFTDGVSETIVQLRERFDLGLIPEMEEFLAGVTDKMEQS